jgi:hypothetical protein
MWVGTRLSGRTEEAPAHRLDRDKGLWGDHKFLRASTYLLSVFPFMAEAFPAVSHIQSLKSRGISSTTVFQ